MAKVISVNLNNKDPKSVGKVFRSNKAHERCLKKNTINSRNYYYHYKCIRIQNNESRVLSKNGRKKIWNELSVAPW